MNKRFVCIKELYLSQCISKCCWARSIVHRTLVWRDNCQWQPSRECQLFSLYFVTFALSISNVDFNEYYPKLAKLQNEIVNLFILLTIQKVVDIYNLLHSKQYIWKENFRLSIYLIHSYLCRNNNFSFLFLSIRVCLKDQLLRFLHQAKRDDRLKFRSQKNNFIRNDAIEQLWTRSYSSKIIVVKIL